MIKMTALAFAFVVAAGAGEAARTVTFDKVTYARQFVSGSPTASLAEYIRANETVENWTTLVAVRSFPQLDDPGAAAAELAKTLKKSNPLARFQLLVKEDKSEAMIDFLTWPEDASYSEFNIFRYLRLPGHPGLISYQFAYRFTDTSPEATEQFKQDRRRWVEEMPRADFPVDFAK